MFTSQKSAAVTGFQNHHGARMQSRQKNKVMDIQEIRQGEKLSEPMPQFFRGKNRTSRTNNGTFGTPQQLVKKMGSSMPITSSLPSVSTSNITQNTYDVHLIAGASQSDLTLGASITFQTVPGQQARYLEILNFYHLVLNIIELNNSTTNQIAYNIGLYCDQLAGSFDQNGNATHIIANARACPSSVIPQNNFSGINVVWKSSQIPAYDVTALNRLDFRVVLFSSTGTTFITFPTTKPFFFSARAYHVVI